MTHSAQPAPKRAVVMIQPNPLVAGLACRCPNCGRGSLFQGFIKVRPVCQACGFDLAAADSGDGPVVFILLIVGAIGCAGLLFTEVAFRPPIWLEIIVWLPLVGLLALLALRPFKGVMLAMQFRHRAGETRHEGDG